MAELYQTNAQLTTKMAQLLTLWNQRETQFADWLGGTATGGPNGDGKYLLSPSDGPGSLVFSPAALASSVSGPAAASAASAATASAKAAEALQSATRGEADRILANTARVQSEAARNLAKTYQDQTAWYWSQVSNSHTYVTGALATTLAARDEALEAREGIFDVRDESIVLRDATISAKNDAVTARNNAQAWAEAVNPDNLATKAELATKLSLSGGTLTGNLFTKDIQASRGDGTGAIFLGDGGHYLYWDKTNYHLPSGGLLVNNRSILGELDGRLKNSVGVWQTSADGKDRLHFQTNGNTYIKGLGVICRNNGDEDILRIASDGNIWSPYYGWFNERFAYKVSTQRPGVTRLYRRDEDSGFNVQTSWTGSKWLLQGFSGDTFHADVRVQYADTLQGLGPSDFIRRSSAQGDNPAWSRSLVLAGNSASYDIWSPPLELREINWVGNTTNDPGYAPGIVFHWGGVVGTAMKMYADGSIRFTAQGSDAYAYRPVYASYLYSSGDITAYSDRRLKSNIRTIEGALGLVKRLRGTRYTKDGKPNIGVIAQEVQEVFPELIHEVDNGILTVALPNLVAVLIEAVKELADVVEGQR